MHANTPARMASVELKNLSKVFSGPRQEEVFAVHELSLAVNDGEFVVLAGPSGCGKTTLLRLLAGLETPTGGTISIDGVAVNEVAPQDRDVAMVLQNASLLPHLTVRENIAFGLTLRRAPAAEIEQRVKEAATLLNLAKLLDRAPASLSGGQRQRVALARAVVRRPKLFLFDEPLSNLDAISRTQLRLEIARLQQRLDATILYVTHDQAEAMTLAHRLAIMKEGGIQQIGAPQAIYQTPANSFVAGFLGTPPMNFFRGQVLGGEGGFVFRERVLTTSADPGPFDLPLSSDRAHRLTAFAEGRVILGLRPEHIRPAAPGHATARARIDLIEFLGFETLLHASSGGHTFVARVPGTDSARVGDSVHFHFDSEQATFFHPASEKIIT